MWIDHPARQGERATLLEWLRFHIGIWMQHIGADWERRALYPNDVRCPECGQWGRPGIDCDHIPF